MYAHLSQATSSIQLQTYVSRTKPPIKANHAETDIPIVFPPTLRTINSNLNHANRQKEKQKQTDGTPVALFNMFVQRCRDQLHIVLAMSPIGDAFRTRLRKFPSLINCCTIDWFQVRPTTPPRDHASS